MVHIVRSLLGAAALFSVSSAVPMPRPDSAIGAEVPVSAPNGTPTSEPASQATGGNYGSENSGSKDSYGGSQGGYNQGGGYGGSYNQGSSYSQGGYNQGGYSSSSMMEESSTMMEEMTSTMAAESSYSTPSYSSSASYSMATYGSGSQSWGGSGYNDCVQQCAASYGGPPMTMSPSPTDGGSGGVSGSGATHTIIVAPSAGVLKYIPFSTNASVGDTLEFKWNAGPHFVSRSSALEVCNKTDAGFFTSGKQDAGFTFHQVVNDTKPIWFYCSVPGHCQKGMFGGVNIGQADPTGSDSSSNSSSSSDSSSNYMSLSNMMSNMTQMDADMSAMWSYTKSQTGDNAYANGWGMSTNLAGMNQDAMMQTAQNVMYNQMVIAMNPDNVKDGKFLVSQNMKMPQDLSTALSSTSANTSGAAGASGSSSSASSAASPSATDAPTNAANSNSNGAGSISSSSVAVGLVAVVATFMAL